MSRLQEAQGRLAVAIDRLEAALGRSRDSGRGLVERAGRISELERELERLNRDHMALEATVDQVTARLDVAISRLKTSVEE
jgi:hypothetical protein